MWEGIKLVAGLILFLGIALALVSTVFIFGWVFKILGVLLAAAVVLFLVVYTIWSLLIGWWQDR